MNKKEIAISIIVLGLIAAVPAFAQIGVATTTVPGGSGTAIACVGAAVNTRETALDAGANTYSQAALAAYSARATALQQAYTLTTNSDVKAAVKAAWSAFKTSIQGAKSTWQSTRTDAWNQFASAAKACKASGISDTAYSTAGLN